MACDVGFISPQECGNQGPSRDSTTFIQRNRSVLFLVFQELPLREITCCPRSELV